MTRALFFLGVLTCSSSAIGQGQFSLYTGVGTYLMKDLRAHQKSVVRDAPVEMKSVSEFSPFVHFGGSFVYSLSHRLALGLNVEYGSSGSRADYHDYSGYLQFDQLVNYWVFQCSIQLSRDIGSGKYRFYFDPLPGTTFTNLELRFKEKIGTGGESRESYEFRSLNVAAQPTLGLARRWGNFEACLYAGLNVNIIQGKLKWKENSDAYLEDDKGEPVTADWTGFRLGLKVNYRFAF